MAANALAGFYDSHNQEPKTMPGKKPGPGVRLHPGRGLPQEGGERGMEVDNAKFLWSGFKQYRCQIYFGGSPLPLNPKRFIWFQTLVREISCRRAASDWLSPIRSTTFSSSTRRSLTWMDSGRSPTSLRHRPFFTAGHSSAIQANAARRRRGF